VSFLSDATVRHLKEVAGWPEPTSDRYLIAEEIGRGGMGTVYAARDTALVRDVAIKVGNALPDAELHVRLTREAQVLARLEHPGIVPVHDYGTLADGRPFYVMKRVQGRTLHEHLLSAPVLAERLRVFERVCEAVSFAHARGIIHRDLKPANVMVGDFGEVMVTDWGIAASPDDTSQAGAIIGTRGFMPPEQAAGNTDVDERADVYALGAMLSMLASHGAAPLRSIAARAMAPAPADRYATVAALADDVRRFREGDAVGAHRENVLERTSRFVRKYQVPILLVLAYIVMRAIIALFAGA
jgi:aminoglycoside phosphotransferase (APT) family kinase protein